MPEQPTSERGNRKERQPAAKARAAEQRRRPGEEGWRAAENIEYEETPDEPIVEDAPEAIDDRRLHASRKDRANRPDRRDQKKQDATPPPRSPPSREG